MTGLSWKLSVWGSSSVKITKEKLSLVPVSLFRIQLFWKGKSQSSQRKSKEKLRNGV